MRGKLHVAFDLEHVFIDQMYEYYSMIRVIYVSKDYKIIYDVSISSYYIRNNIDLLNNSNS